MTSNTPLVSEFTESKSESVGYQVTLRSFQGQINKFQQKDFKEVCVYVFDIAEFKFKVGLALSGRVKIISVSNH